MMKAILICGKICSGKSTYAEKLRIQNKAVLLSVDEITLALYSEHIGENHDEIVEKTQEYLFEKSLEIISVGIPVILDWGFWTEEERDDANEFYASRGIPIQWHYVDVSDETWRKNLEKRNAAVKAGTRKFYLIDDNIAAKFSGIFEEPSSGEMDVWYKNDWDE